MIGMIGMIGMGADMYWFYLILFNFPGNLHLNLPSTCSNLVLFHCHPLRVCIQVKSSKVPYWLPQQSSIDAWLTTLVPGMGTDGLGSRIPTYFKWTWHDNCASNFERLRDASGQIQVLQQLWKCLKQGSSWSQKHTVPFPSIELHKSGFIGHIFHSTTVCCLRWLICIGTLMTTLYPHVSLDLGILEHFLLEYFAKLLLIRWISGLSTCNYSQNPWDFIVSTHLTIILTNYAQKSSKIHTSYPSNPIIFLILGILS